MTTALTDQVLAGDLEAVRAAVKDLPEVDRRRLARSAIRLLREVRAASPAVVDLSNLPGETIHLRPLQPACGAALQ